MTNKKIPVVLNLIIFALEVFGSVSMVIGFNFMSDLSVLSEPRLEAFKYFTLDSNILAGVCSLVLAVFQIRQLKGKIKEIPAAAYILKFVSCGGITLTMMTTLFFLAPRADEGYFSMFLNANLFLHFVIPVLCLVSFIFFERTNKISFKNTFFGILPMLIYSIPYTINVFLHMENGKPTKEADFYNFCFGNIINIAIALPAVFVITYLFCLLIWKANKTK